MYFKFFLCSIVFLTSNLLIADNFMMNCITPDYKNTSFYKYSNSDRYLFIRPMKNKWKDFCEVNLKNEKKVNCKFDQLNIVRDSIIIDGDIYIKKSIKINFLEYSLIERNKIFRNNDLVNESTYNHKCRKIKI